MTINPKVAQIRQNILALFPELTPQEIQARQQTDLVQLDVVKIIIENFIAGKTNLDFRYYRSVNLDNTMFIGVPFANLDAALKYTKFNQQFFVLFNFGENQFSVRIGDQNPCKNVIKETDYSIKLQGSHVITNCANVGNVGGNIKLGPRNISFSFIFDNIGKLPLDTRESIAILDLVQYEAATKGDQSLAGNWGVNLYSMYQANIVGDASSRTPKFTYGQISNVYNEDVAQLNVFTYSNMNTRATTYYDTNGKTFPTHSVDTVS